MSWIIFMISQLRCFHGADLLAFSILADRLACPDCKSPQEGVDLLIAQQERDVIRRQLGVPDIQF